MFKTVFINTSAQLIGKIATGALTFVATLVLARTLGLNFFGQYIAILAYLSFFYVLVDLGINPIFLRLFQSQLEKKISSLFTLRLLWSLFLALFATAGIYALKAFNSRFTQLMVWGVGVGTLTLVTNAFLSSATAFFQARLRYDRVVLSQVIGTGVAVGALLFIYPVLETHPELGVILSLAIFAGGGVVSVIVALFFLRPVRLLSSYIPRATVWLLLKQSLPLGATLVLNVVYFRLDTLVLTNYRSSSEVGAYGLAYKFFEFALVIPTYLMNSVYPYWLKERKKTSWLTKNIKQIFVSLFGLGVLGLITLWWAAPLLRLIRTDFSSSVELLRVLSLSLPLFFISSPLMWLYILWGKQKQLVLIYGLSLVVNLILNLVWIPRFGGTAAAVTTGITELVVVILSALFLFPRKSE